MARASRQRGAAMAQSSFDVFIDSSAYVALFALDDPLTDAAKQAFDTIKQKRLNPVTSSLVVGEVITVLSIRGGQDLARLFLSSLEDSQMSVLFVNEDMHDEAILLFKQQSKKGTSYVDCTDYVVMQKLDIPYILSFDEFHRRMSLKTPFG
jgi:predicted nucleic acid-binding protein